MAIDSISSGSSYTSQVQLQSQLPSERVGERENDNDTDDARTAAAANVAQKPTVNTSGQTIGSIINVTA